MLPQRLLARRQIEDVGESFAGRVGLRIRELSVLIEILEIIDISQFQTLLSGLAVIEYGRYLVAVRITSLGRHYLVGDVSACRRQFGIVDTVPRSTSLDIERTFLLCKRIACQ